MELKASANRGQCSIDGRELQFVSLTFRAPELESSTKRPQANLALVLDRSGSMAGSKIRLARKAVETGLSMLRERDRFALVVFDQHVDVIASSQHASATQVRAALRALQDVDARDATDLGAAWTRGADEIEPHRLPEEVSRVILVTDGMANHGMVDPDALLDAAARLRERGVTTSTIGIGSDFAEQLLQGMADRGGGHAYYAETAVQLSDMLAGEIGETLEVTLREPVVEVTVPEGVGVELLDAFPVTRRNGAIEIALGNLTAGQWVELIFEVSLPTGRVGDALALGFTVMSGSERALVARTELRWSYDTPANAAAAPRNRELETVAAELLVARAQEEALNLNRAGRYEEAEAVIADARLRMRSLAVGNPVVNGIERSLESRAGMFSRSIPMSEMKSLYTDSSSRRRGRTPAGSARMEPAPSPDKQ